jgi:hypothetical protein
MVEEIQEYQSEWHNNVERICPERLPWQTFFNRPVGRRRLWTSKKKMGTAIPLVSERVITQSLNL